jgi:protein-L-isoaspartate O-methyltransferase
MEYTATYSPEDNKLRLYSVSRLPKDLYDEVKAHGFKWAPKQELFVAPMWTPSREDFLLSLCDEIDDEDTSLVDRAEIRAERFDDYSEKREAEAERAHDYVSSIADNIPLGQPILVGHHSERRARRDAEKIENGMRRAIKLWDTSKYWTMRAKGALAHAKYKERSDVRARRIKGLEADRRKHERNKAEAEKWLRLWSKDGLTQEQGIAIANVCWLTLPRREGDKPDFNGNPTAYDALNNSHPTLYAPRTLEEVIAVAKKVYPRAIAYADRWISHIDNRLAYERAMLGESGGLATDRTGPEVKGAIRCWCSPRGGWSYIVKVNKVTVAVLDNWGNGGRNFERKVKLDDIKAVMTRAEVEQAREQGRLAETANGLGFYLTDTPIPTPAPAPEPDPQAEKFEALKQTAKAGVQVVSAPQLFPTPRELAEQMIDRADIRAGNRILEPSAGTGNLIRAMGEQMLGEVSGEVVAVEINQQLAVQLRQLFPMTDVRCADFLTCNGDLGKFDRIIMNPEFQNAADIKHITHAVHFLKPGGRLVALCANGSRQREALKPLADEWEDLPAGSFLAQGTNVNVALLVINGPAADRLF